MQEVKIAQDCCFYYNSQHTGISCMQKKELFLIKFEAQDPSLTKRGPINNSLWKLNTWAIISMARTLEYMGNARALVFPSLWYEGMPRAIIEAFSRGTPVIANRCGSMTEMVRHEETGWLVESGNCGALADAITAAFSEQFDRALMRSAVRVEFERNYTADRQYDLLMDAYKVVIEAKLLQ